MKHNTDFTPPVKLKTLITAAAACNPLVNQKETTKTRKTWKTS